MADTKLEATVRACTCLAVEFTGNTTSSSSTIRISKCISWYNINWTQWYTKSASSDLCNLEKELKI